MVVDGAVIVICGVTGKATDRVSAGEETVPQLLVTAHRNKCALRATPDACTVKVFVVVPANWALSDRAVHPVPSFTCHARPVALVAWIEKTALPALHNEIWTGVCTMLTG